MTVDAIEVDDKAIRIIGNKDVLQTVIAGKLANRTRTEMFRGFVRKWRAVQHKTANFYVVEITT